MKLLAWISSSRSDGVMQIFILFESKVHSGIQGILACFKGISRKFQGLTKKIHGCFVFQKVFKGVLRWFKGVSWVFQRRFKGFYSEFKHALRVF